MNSESYIGSTLLKAEARPLLLPCTMGNITVLELGTICPLHTFFSKHLLYPVGYKAIHVLSEPYPLSLTCRIEKGDQSEPVFIVESDGVKVQSATPSSAWDEVMHVLNGKGSMNGVEAFGLCIPEIAIAISELHGVALCSGYEGPLIPPEKVSDFADWETVMASQWHPACCGYAMNPDGENINTSLKNPDIMNPIFLGYSQETALCCDACGLPATKTDRLSPLSICDVDMCVKNLLENGSTEVIMRERCMHTNCSQMTLRRLQEKIKSIKRELLK